MKQVVCSEKPVTPVTLLMVNYLTRYKIRYGPVTFPAFGQKPPETMLAHATSGQADTQTQAGPCCIPIPPKTAKNRATSATLLIVKDITGNTKATNQQHVAGFRRNWGNSSIQTFTNLPSPLQVAG